MSILRNKIVLDKSNKYCIYSIEISPFLIKSNNQKTTRIFKSRIRYFLQTLKTKCKNFNESIFLEQFEKTKFFIDHLHPNLRKGINGRVEFGFRNKYMIRTFKVTYHELLHLSSYSEKENFKPFIEGYTQLIAERYFDEKTNAYGTFVAIMHTMECIFDKDNLEKAYFNGNLISTISKGLKEYGIDLKKFSKLVYELFVMSEKSEKENFDYEKFADMLETIYSILLYCFKQKIENIEDPNQRKKEIDDLYVINRIQFKDKSELVIIDEQKFNNYKESLMLSIGKQK